jgi:hypothetical protein
VTLIGVNDAVSAVAGLAVDNRSATLLLSNLHESDEAFKLAIKALPWMQGTRCELYLLNAEHDLERTTEEWFNTPSFVMGMRVPAAALILAKLAPSGGVM